MYDKDLSKVYWGSHPQSQHSLNVKRNSKAFLVLYDSTKPKLGGVYLQLENCHELAGEELTQGLSVHNEFRARENKQPISRDYYEDQGPQRMYSGTLAKCWVLMKENGADGLRIRDYREEIDVKFLTPLY